MAAPAAEGRRSHWPFTLFKIAISVVTFGALLYFVDLSAAWQHMRNQNLWLLLLALTVVLLQLGLGGLRWHLVLTQLAPGPSIAQSIRIFAISAFFNACFLGTVGGDVVRVWLTHRTHVDTATSIRSVILDRVAALAGVAILVILTAPLFAARVGGWIPAYLPAGLAAAGLAAIAVAGQFDRLPARWFRAKPLQHLRVLGSATRSVFLRPAVVPILVVAVAAQTLMALSAYAVAESMGIGVTPIDCLVLMQPVVLLGALPISIGGWGVRETAMVGLFGLIGVPADAALAISVQIGLLATVAGLPGGLLWLMLRRDTRMAAA